MKVQKGRTGQMAAGDEPDAATMVLSMIEVLPGAAALVQQSPSSPPPSATGKSSASGG